MKKGSRTTIDVRQENRRNVLRYILAHGPTSRLEIASELGMSLPTILANITELQRLGLVEEAGQYSSTGGRKAAVIQGVADARCVLGVDITRNHVCFALVDFCGGVKKSVRIAHPFSFSAQYREELGRYAAAFLQDTGATKENLLGTGVSFPGIVNEDTGHVLDSHVLSIADVDGDTILGCLPKPYHIINDANAAAFGELSHTGPEQPFLYVSLSNSVGGAICRDRRLFRGLNQRCGEFGHVRIVPGGRRCYCGQEGCFDAYCNAMQLASMAGGKLEAFFEKLSEGNEQCSAAWKEYLHWLALFVINLRMAADYDIVLGGYVGSFLGPWLPELKQLVAQQDPFSQEAEYIRLSRHGQDASAFGAAALLLNQYMESL